MEPKTFVFLCPFGHPKPPRLINPEEYLFEFVSDTASEGVQEASDTITDVRGLDHPAGRVPRADEVMAPFVVERSLESVRCPERKRSEGIAVQVGDVVPEVEEAPGRGEVCHGSSGYFLAPRWNGERVNGDLEGSLPSRSSTELAPDSLRRRRPLRIDEVITAEVPTADC